MEPILTDFKGYEGQCVAIERNSGEVVIAWTHTLCLSRPKVAENVVVAVRVPFADEPMTVGLG